MNKDLIKEQAAKGGYGLFGETSEAILFTKEDKVISINAETNVIATYMGGKTGYNFVDGGSIDDVSKFLLRK